MPKKWRNTMGKMQISLRKGLSYFKTERGLKRVNDLMDSVFYIFNRMND